MNPHETLHDTDQLVTKKKRDPKIKEIKPSEHRLILKFLNDAVRAEDLMYGRPLTTHVHPTEVHPEHHDHEHKRKEIMAV